MKSKTILILFLSIFVAGCTPPVEDAHKILASGVALIEKGKYQEAADAAERLIQISPKAENGYLLRGTANEKLGQFDKAIQDYSTCISITPSAEVFTNRGQMYLQQKKYDKGIEDCNKALSLDAKFYDARVCRGTCYSDLGQYQKALDDFNVVLATDPKNDIALQNRASCLLQLRKATAAKAGKN